MSTFLYTASAPDGRIEKGLVEAPDQKTLEAELKRNNLKVISIAKRNKIAKSQSNLNETAGVKKTSWLSGLFSGSRRSKKIKTEADVREEIKHTLEVDKKKKGISINLGVVFGRVKQVDKILFAKYLSALIKGGVSLGESLVILKRGTTSAKLKVIIDDLINATEAGRSLHSGLAEHPQTFNNFFVNMVMVGEKGGTLDESLGRLSIEIQKNYELRKKIKGVMFYPALILTLALSVGLLLSIFILPKLTKLFESFGVALPLSTKIFLAIASVLQHHGVFIFPGIFAFFMMLSFLAKTKFGAPIVHRLILSLPISSKMSRQINLTNFSRTLGTLIKSGLQIVEALTVTANGMTNIVYKNKLKEAVIEIKKGVPMSAVLEKETKLFPTLATSVISVGEKIGKLDETLLFISEFYEEEVNAMTKNLATIIEPVIMVIIGLTVGGMALAIVTPIYQLTTGI